MKVPIKDWRDTIQKGDILVSKRGPRLVRRATYSKTGFLRAITLAIKHCSWTGRCYTVINRSDLNYLKFTKAPFRITATRIPLDEQIEACIIDPDNRSLDCCDVKGVL